MAGTTNASWSILAIADVAMVRVLYLGALVDMQTMLMLGESLGLGVRFIS